MDVRERSEEDSGTKQPLLSSAEKQIAQEDDAISVTNTSVQNPPETAAHEEPAPYVLGWCQYLILVSLNSLGAFSSDCYVPNLSDVTRDLRASDELVSLTIQINWILLGLFTPIVGHASDVYGRRPVITVFLCVYIAGALGSGYAPTIEWLLVARCVQGAGEAVSIVTSAILRDLLDDPDERMKVQAIFSMMRPLMLLAGPSVGGALGDVIGWRNLMKVLACWGVSTLFLMFCIPESRAPPTTQRAGGVFGGWGCSLSSSKFRRMWYNSDFVGLTIAAALFMGSIRAMLSNISFVYDHYYHLPTYLTGILISFPPLFGFIAALIASYVAGKWKPGKLMRWGMLFGLVPIACMLVSAGVPDCVRCLYSQGWWMTTLPCSLMASTGFFALPAMQVLVLQDFRDMSGLAGGLSKLVMTLISTGLSMAVSFYFGHPLGGGEDSKNHWTHYHTQRLLYSLAAVLIVTQLWFWAGYVPWKRWESGRVTELPPRPQADPRLTESVQPTQRNRLEGAADSTGAVIAEEEEAGTANQGQARVSIV